MKSVQEWLLELDEDAIIGCYFVKYPIDFDMLENKDIKVSEVLAVSKARLRGFIHRLKALAAPESGSGIFYAVKTLSGGHEEIAVKLSYRKDILENDLPEHYGWMLTDHKEVMGYLIADTSLTQNNIESVMAEILYEMSFFGYTQEALDKEQKKLNESLKASLKEIEEGRSYTADEVFARIEAKLGLAPEEKDERSDELRSAALTAEVNFGEYWRTREALQIRSQLMA